MGFSLPDASSPGSSSSPFIGRDPKDETYYYGGMGYKQHFSESFPLLSATCSFEKYHAQWSKLEAIKNSLLSRENDPNAALHFIANKQGQAGLLASMESLRACCDDLERQVEMMSYKVSQAMRNEREVLKKKSRSKLSIMRLKHCE